MDLTQKPRTETATIQNSLLENVQFMQNQGYVIVTTTRPHGTTTAHFGGVESALMKEYTAFNRTFRGLAPGRKSVQRIKYNDELTILVKAQFERP